jgi:uncharacterized protein (TIGR02246 family)
MDFQRCLTQFASSVNQTVSFGIQTMKRRFVMIVPIALVLAGAQLVGAAEPVKEPAPAKAQSAAEQAVRKAAQEFDAAFNSGSADKIAALWTADAEYVDEDGVRYVGRDMIKKEYGEFFAASPQSKIRSLTDSVRLINGTTAIEDGRAMVDPPPAGAPATSRFTALYVLQDGKWLLSSVHDMRVAAPSNYHRLDDFEWIIGTWKGGGGDVQIETTCHWLGNKSFIERTYQVITAGLPSSSGTQIIGWDPELQQMCSWNFTSDSGYAKEVWKPRTGGWWTQSVGALGDGTKTTAVKIFQRVDDDTLTLQSTERTLGGVRLPDLKEVIFKRVVTKPAT